MHRRFRSAVPVGLLALLLAVPACGTDSDDSSGTTTSGPSTTDTTAPSTSVASTGSTTTPPSSTATSGPDVTLPGADTSAKTGEAEGRGALVAVRTGRHEGFDRVTFEFEGLRPGYQVEYVDPPITQDASGDVVEVNGNAFLQVRFEPASGFDVESGQETYTGPDVVEGNGTTNVQGWWRPVTSRPSCTG
jgi:hypothetical protein